MRPAAPPAPARSPLAAAWLRRARLWWAVLALLVAADLIALLILRHKDRPAAAFWVNQAAGLAASLWCYFGAWVWWQRRWVRSAAYALFSASAIMLLGLALAIRHGLDFNTLLPWTLGEFAILTFLGGMWGMSVLFWLGLFALRWVLSGSAPAIGVARTLVLEAVRTRLAPVFLVLAALMIAGVPVALDPKELLRYRLQTYLSQSLWWSGLVLAVFTLVLACWTVSSELARRHVYLSLTKPLSRAQYLLGKWLGIGLIDLLLVAVCGAGIFTGANLLAQHPDRGARDLMAVQQQVLIARAVVTPEIPTPSGLTPAEHLDRFAEARLPVRREDPKIFPPEEYPVGKPVQFADLSPRQREALRHDAREQWFTIGEGDRRAFLFTGLEAAKAGGGFIQIRLHPTGTRTDNGLLHFGMLFNGRPCVEFQGGRPVVLPGPVANDNVYLLDLSTRFIDPQGDLLIEIDNTLQPGTLTFDPEKGLLALYVAGGFGPNLAKAMALLWAQLAFLAMLGLALGALMPFPVALVLGLGIFLPSAAGTFLDQALAYYGGDVPDQITGFHRTLWLLARWWSSLVSGDVGTAIRLVIRMIGQAVAFFLPPLGKYDATELITDGRRVSWSMLGAGLVWLGLLRTAAVAVLAWLILRGRELARVIV